VSEDGRLLRLYREQGSEAAFARLAARHLDFVYATCLRETNNAAVAEEAAQVVFLLLAKKAPPLRPDQSLSGWLFQTARFAARNARRRGERRKAWEEQAMAEMPSIGREGDALWDRIAPAVNDALAALGAKDREAVLLRFAEGLSFPELGTALGTSEDAARMRLNRAVDRLRRFFAKEGVTLSVAALTGLLADRITQAASVQLAEAMSQTLPKFAAGSQVHLLYKGALKTMQMMKLKVAALLCGAGLVIAVTGFGIVKTTALPVTVRVANTKAIKPMPLTKGTKQTQMNTSATIVQDYLDACNSKNFGKAYQLLAPATQQVIPLSLFQQVKQLPTDPTADGMTPTLTATSALFIDAPHSLGYYYKVLGPSPDDPSVVLVQAQSPATALKGILHLKIATTSIESAHAPLIDMIKSMQASDPDGVKKASQWAADKRRAE